MSENAFYLPCFNFLLYLILFYSVYFFLCETNKKEVVSISLTSGNDEQRNCDYDGQWDYFEEEEEQQIKDALNDEVFSAYEWNYHE